MSIFKSTFSETISSQLKAREKVISNSNPRDATFLQFSSGNNSWVRMTSFVNYDDPKKRYSGDDLSKKYILEGNINDANSQEITLYPKLPIICKKNDEPQGLINNEQFIVSKLTSTSVYVKNKEKKLKIEINKFQELFYPAYCITIHKSQGSTYNFPYTIHEFNRLNKRLRYVALTRATDKKFINIISH
jgi:hypothetical protein